MKTESLEDVFVKLLELAHVRGLRDFEKVPGCFELQVNSEWAIVLNPHRVTTSSSAGVDLPPWHMTIEKKGVYVGISNHFTSSLLEVVKEEFLVVLNEQITVSEIQNIWSELKLKNKTESEENDYSKMH